MAAESQISAEVRSLLDVVDSFEKLEILCRVGARVDVLWTVLEISEKLGMSPEALEEPARDLMLAGLIERDADGRLRLAVKPGSAAQAVASLIKLYQDDKLLVVRVITQRAMQRLRTNAARTFADAFVIRRPKPEESS